MGISFLSPWAFAVGAAGARRRERCSSLSERRSRRLCAVLGLEPRPVVVGRDRRRRACRRSGSCSARPPRSPSSRRSGRRTGGSDAEAIVVFDISRSMLARKGPAGATRLERARTIAKQLRAELDEVPFGVSSLTDRLLPHLFPTMSATAFTSTVDRAIQIERPPPERLRLARDRVRRAGRPRPPELLRRCCANTGRDRAHRRREHPVQPERAPRAARRRVACRSTSCTSGTRTSASTTRGRRPERYRPSPTSRAVIDRIAREIGGGVFAEGQVDAGARRRRAKLGDGPLAAAGT